MRIIFFAVPLIIFAKTVYLLPQHHLLATQSTQNIEQSKKLSQYTNQSAIYLVLDDWIAKKKLSIIIAEGCSGEINEKFSDLFNGWSYQALAKLSQKNNYQDILTHIPLKLEAKYKDQLITLCGDSPELMKQHQLIFSDLKGYAGYQRKLKSLKPSSLIHKNYLSALEEGEKRKIKYPLEYLKKKIESLFKEEKKVLKKRNLSFVDIIHGRAEKNIAVVIGARHVKDLKAQLEKTSIKVIIPKIIQDTIPNL